MSYIALKPCKFDRTYAIGELIPDGVVDPKRESDLINEFKIIGKVTETQLQEMVNANPSITIPGIDGNSNQAPNIEPNTGVEIDENGYPIPPAGEQSETGNEIPPTPELDENADPIIPADEQTVTENEGTGTEEVNTDPNAGENVNAGTGEENVNPADTGAGTSEEETFTEPTEGGSTETPVPPAGEETGTTETDTTETGTGETGTTGATETGTTEEPTNPDGAIVYTATQLSRMVKAELIEVGRSLGLQVDSTLTNQQLIDCILGFQGTVEGA